MEAFNIVSVGRTTEKLLRAQVWLAGKIASLAILTAVAIAGFPPFSCNALKLRMKRLVMVREREVSAVAFVLHSPWMQRERLSI